MRLRIAPKMQIINQYNQNARKQHRLDSDAVQAPNRLALPTTIKPNIMECTIPGTPYRICEIPHTCALAYRLQAEGETRRREKSH